MLKKAGIVVAAAAVTLLSISPLAFAGEDGHNSDGDSYSSSVDHNADAMIDRSANGVVDLSHNNLEAPINACNDQVPVNVLGVQVPLNDNTIQATDLLGGLGLLGEGKDKDSGDTSLDESCHANADGDTGDSDNG